MMNFREVELGQALPSVIIAAPTVSSSAGRLLEQFVRGWAGVEAVLEKVSVTWHPPAHGAGDLQLAGQVYGRHMDGSGCVEIRVTGRDDHGDRLAGMVRVKLA